MSDSPISTESPIQVGLIGTGYAAKLRAESLEQDSRARLCAVAGHSPERTAAFSQTYGAEAFASWTDLLEQAAVDLVIVATINRDHGTITRAALEAGKHVVVEYPLSLDVAEAEALLALAHERDRLLHVEHIELLGGMHRALKANIAAVGNPFYSRYATINPQRPAPHKWTYNSDLFGFPLIGALSRLHRLTDLFGSVATVTCQLRYWPSDLDPDAPYYRACLCTAHLAFTAGVVAEVTYGKGEFLWHPERRLEVHGETGALIFDGDQGKLIQPDAERPIEVGSRRGLFGKDTTLVLDHLTKGRPLYVTPEASIYALKVGDAARRSALRGETIALEVSEQEQRFLEGW